MGDGMKKIAIAGSVCTALLLSPATAADFPIKAPPPAPVVSAGWTGFYAGVHGGYAWGHDSYTFPPRGGFGGVVAPFATGGSFDQDFKGGVVGAHLGFNYQIGNVVVGLEYSLSATDLHTGSVNVLGPFFPGNTTYGVALQWLATITPRLGVAVNDWVLLYVKGGLAAGKVETEVANTSFPLLYF